jgi:hypothetical protein
MSVIFVSILLFPFPVPARSPDLAGLPVGSGDPTGTVGIIDRLEKKG